MDGVFIGQIIKQKREELGLSQEELCEGICSPPTLSRIENGRQAPSYNRMNALLQRLGLPENRYYALMTKQELEIDRLQREIVACNMSYSRSQGNQRVEAHNSGLAFLAELEKIIDEDDNITRQFILRSKAILFDFDDFEAQQGLLLEAIRLTVPGFDEDEINSRLYSLTEVKIIVQIAVNYAKYGQQKKAIGLLGQLLKYAQKHFGNNTQAAKHLSHITYNYALELGLAGRYEDSLEIAELGRQISTKYGYYRFLPGIAHIMAEDYYYLGNHEKSRDFYYQAYYVYKLINNERDLAKVEADAKKYLNICFV